MLTWFHDFNGGSGSYPAAAEIICPANLKMPVIVPVTEVSQYLLCPTSGHASPAPSFSGSWLGCPCPPLSCFAEKTHFTLPGFLIWPWVCFYYNVGYPPPLLQNSTFTFLSLSLQPWTLYPPVFPVPGNQGPILWLIYDWSLEAEIGEQRWIYSGIIQSAISVVISRKSKLQPQISLLDPILKMLTF